MKAPSTIAQLQSILALPAMALIVVPYILLNYVSVFFWNPISNGDTALGKVFGILLFIPGALLFAQSVILFIKIGKGTLAPWNPTRKLVVKSLYRHVRNPMILGVLTILLAEAFFFGSFAILVWALSFFGINHFYFVLKEEPDLLKRFGEEYQEYKNNVPRWIPRISGWKPERN